MWAKCKLITFFISLYTSLRHAHPFWTQQDYGTFTYWAVKAQLVILWGREGLFSLEFPRGSELEAAVGPCPAASSVWRGPEGQRQGSLWHWIICLSVIVPAGRGAQDCVSMCVYEKYFCRVLLQAHLCFSRFNIHLLHVNTVPVFRWNADTSNLSMPLYRHCPIEGALAVH